MKTMRVRVLVHLSVAALLLTLVPPHVLAAGARLEGYVIDVDGRAATGHRVHLIDREGRDVAQAPATDEGIYRFRDLRPGAYAVGIETPAGKLAPVVAGPLRLQADELARRDIKLMNAPGTPQPVAGSGMENQSAGVWWAGLAPGLKALTIIGGFVVVGLTIAALDSDSENPATVF
jgi:hypothetical protein